MLATLPTIINSDHARVGDWMALRGAGQYRDGSTCIGLERDGQLVAGTMYDYHNGASIFCNIAIDGPVTRRFLWFICYYPFVQLGCKTILGLVSEGNARSRRFVEHFGFTLLKPIPHADPSGDLLLYTMTLDQCRFLKGRYV